MRLYKVRRDMRYVGHDNYDSVVVKARNKERALLIAIEFASEFDRHSVSVEEIHLDDIEEVVLGSYNAG